MNFVANTFVVLITPLSPRWKSGIEQRIQQARHLTMDAVGRGARLPPGQFWDLSGTFLFCVYVMTALGFGAPVPHTTPGKTSALIYAVVAVPTHIYLVYHASMCIVVYVEAKTKCKFIERHPCVIRKEAVSNSSQNSDLLKATSKHCIRKKIMPFLNVVGICHGVPLAAVLYYVFGALVFGVLREKSLVDVTLFPLEFTTTGGLDCITGYVRILYGFYVQGAMMLLACALATLRRHSNGPIINLSEKYQLFATEE